MHLPDRIQAICWIQFWAWIGIDTPTTSTSTSANPPRLVSLPLLRHHLGRRSLLPLPPRHGRLRLQRHTRRRRPRRLPLPPRLLHHHLRLSRPPPLHRPIPRPRPPKIHPARAPHHHPHPRKHQQIQTRPPHRMAILSPPLRSIHVPRPFRPLPPNGYHPRLHLRYPLGSHMLGSLRFHGY